MGERIREKGKASQENGEVRKERQTEVEKGKQGSPRGKGREGFEKRKSEMEQKRLLERGKKREQVWGRGQRPAARVRTRSSKSALLMSPGSAATCFLFPSEALIRQYPSEGWKVSREKGRRTPHSLPGKQPSTPPLPTAPPAHLEGAPLSSQTSAFGPGEALRPVKTMAGPRGRAGG